MPMKQRDQRSWIIPQGGDGLNYWLWLLAPWLAAIEWVALLMHAEFQPTCCGGADLNPIWTASIVAVLLMVSLRALAWGGVPRLGSLTLAATNGFVLLVFLVSTIVRRLEYREF